MTNSFDESASEFGIAPQMYLRSIPHGRASTDGYSKPLRDSRPVFDKTKTSNVVGANVV
jgi:hypothetical protein